VKYLIPVVNGEVQGCRSGSLYSTLIAEKGFRLRGVTAFKITNLLDDPISFLTGLGEGSSIFSGATFSKLT
jgi:hypothetical protein